MKAAAQNYVEMTPTREENYCCGGSGLVACFEAYDIRMAAGKPKVQQVKNTGAAIVAAACENCRLQLTDLSEFYRTPYQVTALADLVVKAMRLPGMQAEPLVVEAPELVEIAA